MKNFYVNQLFENIAAETVERILWIDALDRGIYAINIQLRLALPIFYTAEMLEKLEADAMLRMGADDPWLAPITEDTIPPRHKALRDKAWKVIKPLVINQPFIFQEASRGPAVVSVMNDTGVTKQTVYRLLRRYWQRGLSPNALLPDYNRCGGPAKEKTVGKTKRGRKPKTDREGVNVTPEMRKLFRDAVTRFYARNSKMDLGKAYHGMVTAYFSDWGVDESTGRQILVTRDDEIPSVGQFRYWYAKENDVFRVARIRRTPRVYDKDMRALLGSSTAETRGPGSRYQIDATIADVYLVSRYDRSKIIGRPVLYVIIDVFSRMIVGFYVGLEGPSWVGAMMALANAASPKIEFCRQLGLEIGEADWPCQHLPDVLLGDRGEIAGRAIETLINNLGVQVENTAPYRADWKGIVERQFRLLPAQFKPYTPGYIEGDYRARGGNDYRLDAVLDIDEFALIILYCILFHNNAHELTSYEKSPQMFADKVRAIPIELWEWGIAHRSGRLRSFPPDLVRLSLLPSGDATVTPRGIRYFGCFYSCSKAIEEHWFERARQRRTWKVRISYEPRCMDEIYLHDESSRTRFISCSLTERSRHHRGRTLWEIDQFRQAERRAQLTYEPEEREARINLAQEIQGVVKGAQEKQKDTDTTDKKRIQNIRKNRREEKRSRQELEAFRLPGREEETKGEVVPFPTVDPEDDYRLPDITEIHRSMKKADEDDGNND